MTVWAKSALRQKENAMSRPLAGFAPDLTALPARRAPLLELDLTVVTPLFGGGAIARKVDRERPVSGKAVRGHLRFWWRACRGAGYVAAQELFEAEARIWGSTELPSPVGLEIDILDKGRIVRWAEYRERWNQRTGRMQTFLDRHPPYPGYALFPFQGEIDRGTVIEDASDALRGVRFRLRLTGAEAHRADVEAAVWAWILFGGVGARVRRGCGTLSCEDPRFRPGLEALTEGASGRISPGERLLPIPLLGQARVLLGRPTGAAAGQESVQQAWVTAIAAMQEFRQGYGVGRRAGPGRSFWPEPDSLREMTGMSEPHHRPEHRARRFYPRADLGLPIVFKFKDNGDPSVRILQAMGDQATRMASPIILKALPLPGNLALPMAVLFNAPHVWDTDAPRVGFGGAALAVNELNDGHKSALVPPMRGKATAREAFFDFAQAKWSGKEITLP